YGAAAWGLVATLAFDTVSVASGGAYWTHYLIEPIAPLAIVTGILIARRQPFVRPIVALTAIAAVISSAIWLSVVKPSTGSDVGHAIQASARPGDTIITIYGHADVVQTSGLSSPYPFLWSLPVKARDPQLNDLSQVLSGPQAPTWFVKWKHIASWGVEPDQVRAIIARDYRLFGHVCGHPVYLREGVTRPRLHAQAKCPNLSVVKTITKDELP
ncbi:MAG: hypothetical protein ABIR57_07175, partial [Aeromicrobium sp.]